MIHFSWQEEQIRFQEVLIMRFLFMTAPVSAHLLAKAALHLRLPGGPALPYKDLEGPGWLNGDGRSGMPVADSGSEPDGARTE